jgi:hypothetical protein
MYLVDMTYFFFPCGNLRPFLAGNEKNFSSQLPYPKF